MFEPNQTVRTIRDVEVWPDRKIPAGLWGHVLSIEGSAVRVLFPGCGVIDIVPDLLEPVRDLA